MASSDVAAAPTIVARATPEGEGGLAVVRLSGEEAATIAGRVFRGPALRARGVVYGILHAPIEPHGDEGQQLDAIDEVLALYLPGPGSYTGEDTVEFFCHGGRQVAARTVRACQAAGAVAAPPGEFTRRAFLSGRLTLDQAEAVADLITAGSELAARAAVAQLRGGLDAELGAIEWPLLDLLTQLEGSGEFSDDEAGGTDTPAAEMRLTLEEAREGIDRLLELAPAGRLLREGIHIALVGAPNAGKSSLFNRLVGSDRALVDPDPGTTRDIVTAQVRRGGRLYVLHDTAGLRAVSGEAARVEAQGIERARAAARDADLVLAVAEAGGAAAPDAGCCAGATEGAAGARCAGASAPPVLRVLAKCDLAARDRGAPGAAGASCADAVSTSSLTGEGLDALWAAIEKQVAAWGLDEAASLGVVLNERHRQRLLECRDELTQLVALLDGGDDDAAAAPGAEVIGTLLASLLARLGEVSGRVFTEQMLDGIFKRFCVGK
ncbi:GTP-binding protein [bacterium]|nr:GTP-binding protein [bacterium]